MEDSTLLNLAVFTALIGLAVLYFAVVSFEPELVRISEINEDMVGTVVRTSGRVVDWMEFENSVLIEIEDGAVLSVFVYKSMVPELGYGRTMEVTGRVQEYKGKLELIPASEGDLVLK